MFVFPYVKLDAISHRIYCGKKKPYFILNKYIVYNMIGGVYMRDEVFGWMGIDAH